MIYPFKTPPRPQQKRALIWLIKHRGGGLQVPMRYGKSKVAIDFAAAMHLKVGVTRILVVTVTSGLGVWEDEIEMHNPFAHTIFDWHGQVLKVGGDREPAEPFKRSGHLEFCLVNFPNVYDRLKIGSRSWSAVPRDVLKSFKPQIIIVDESHHIGNAGSAQFKMTNLLGKDATYRVIMTGTMFHRKPLFVFGQMKFLDHGRSLGSSRTHYEKRICEKGGFGGYELKRYKNLKWMIRRVRQQVLIEKPEPGLPPVETKVPFRLSGDNLDAYREMEKDRLLVVGGEAVMSPLVITRHMRLHMIEGGWIKVGKKYRRVGRDKIILVEDRLQTFMDEDTHKIVVSCRFTPELADVARAAKAVGYKTVLFHGGLDPQERTRRIRAFKNSEDPMIFVSQVATGSQSIDLSAADTMMHYSLSESYLLHDQMCERIKKYKDTRTLQYDYIVPRGTRGEVLYRALKQKKDVAEYIVDNPRLVEKITKRDDLEAAWGLPAHARSAGR